MPSGRQVDRSYTTSAARDGSKGRDTGAAADSKPLFTCFGSANLGLPLNPRDAIYYQSKPDPFGFTPILQVSPSEIWDWDLS